MQVSTHLLYFVQYPSDLYQPVGQELPWRGMGFWAVAVVIRRA
jgi:hypothetical protein